MKKVSDDQNKERLLLDADRLLAELLLWEKQIRQHIINNNPRGLAEAIASSAETLRRGEELMDLIKDGPLPATAEPTALSAVDKDTAAWRKKLMEKIEELGSRQQVNRILLGEGLELARKLREISPAESSTYNSCGEVRSAAGGRSRLDRDC